jgi:hypothetical protein
VIPEGVKEIGQWAFSGCIGLASVVIPESVEKIGGQAFSGCSSLASVAIPEGVKEIGANAFYGCSSLASVAIPESVQVIGKSAFEGCGSLTEIVISNSIVETGEGAFLNCENLKEVSVVYQHRKVSGLGTPNFSDIYINLLDPDKKKIGRIYSMHFQKNTPYDDFLGKLLCGGVNHLSEYDSLFAAAEGNAEEKAKIALVRLLNPLELEKEFENKYRDFRGRY